MTRYPLQPIADALSITLDTKPGRRGGNDHPEGWTALAEALHTDESWLHRYGRTGLSDRQADHFATRIGRHPATVWPDWFDAAPGDGDWYADDPPMRPPAASPPLQRMLVP